GRARRQGAHPEGQADLLDRTGRCGPGRRSRHRLSRARRELRLGHPAQGRPHGARGARLARELARPLPMIEKSRNGIGMTSARTLERLKAEGVRDVAVLERIRSVPRHLFVDEALASRAYEDTPLPIGYSQTISQPLVVALMTEALIAGCEGKKI